MPERSTNLLLLSIMTITFVICSLPFTVSRRRMATSWTCWPCVSSINSIVDPWVFAILRPPVLRLMRSALCCRVPPAAPDSRTVSSAGTKLAARPELCGQ
uniref:G-protein coupled receptors family 1 profile domain-containing protein n=1 Tax=Taeniopygia guttata TaxID=59729 RepID=A0A674H793_TAEGU